LTIAQACGRRGILDPRDAFDTAGRAFTLADGGPRRLCWPTDPPPEPLSRKSRLTDSIGDFDSGLGNVVGMALFIRGPNELWGVTGERGRDSSAPVYRPRFDIDAHRKGDFSVGRPMPSGPHPDPTYGIGANVPDMVDATRCRICFRTAFRHACRRFYDGANFPMNIRATHSSRFIVRPLYKPDGYKVVRVRFDEQHAGAWLTGFVLASSHGNLTAQVGEARRARGCQGRQSAARRRTNGVGESYRILKRMRRPADTLPPRGRDRRHPDGEIAAEGTMRLAGSAVVVGAGQSPARGFGNGFAQRPSDSPRSAKDPRFATGSSPRAEEAAAMVAEAGGECVTFAATSPPKTNARRRP